MASRSNFGKHWEERAKTDARWCWWCGDAATTSEHRLKRSDLDRYRGKGNFVGDQRSYHFRGGKLSRLQSSDAKAVKYAKNLCLKCNSSRSQPFDLAYDKFVLWALNEENNLSLDKVINFELIYDGHDVQREMRNLLRYYAKSFCCRLAEAGITVPSDLVSLLQSVEESRSFLVTFSIETNDITRRSVRSYDLTEWRDGDEANLVRGYECGQGVYWLNVNYWYCIVPNASVTQFWNGEQTVVPMWTALAT